MKGYKVLMKGESRFTSRRKSGKLFSATASGEGQVEYKVGEQAHPKLGCGPLCVFSSIKTAWKFIYEWTLSHEEFAIYLCDYIPDIRNISVWTVTRSSFIPEIPGTILAKSIKIIKVVNSYENSKMRKTEKQQLLPEGCFKKEHNDDGQNLYGMRFIRVK